jgi:hypothetical protein
MEEGRGVYKVLVGGPRRRWEDNIKVGFRRDRDRWGGLDSAVSG